MLYPNVFMFINTHSKIPILEPPAFLILKLKTVLIKFAEKTAKVRIEAETVSVS